MRDDSLLSDRALLTRYYRGDRRGAELLFVRYSGSLLEYLLKRLGRRDLAEESLQETFVRLLERASGLMDHPHLEAWLFSVARNVAADVLRRRRGRAAAFSDLKDAAFEGEIKDSATPHAEARFQSSELNVLLLRSLGALPAPERTVFLLRAQRMLSFREIAEEVGAPLNTVLSRMHRAMKRIRKSMIREGWAGEP